jgi:hypothetical protein
MHLSVVVWILLATSWICAPIPSATIKWVAPLIVALLMVLFGWPPL